MIVQAEHIPVHLGAMPEAVAAVLARDPQPGEVYVVTTPSPAARIFPTSRSSPACRAASRARGASRRRRRHGAGQPARWLDRHLPGGPRVAARAAGRGSADRPSRTCGTRRSARRSQRPASRSPVGGTPPRRARRAARCGNVRRPWTSSTVLRARRPRCHRRPSRRRYEAHDALEPATGELEIRVAVTIAGDEIEIDFAGTSPQHEGNLNCPLAVTRSACYFVVRCLTKPDLPSSGGAYAPVTRRGSGGLARERLASRCGRRRQHRDVEPDRRRRLLRVR